MNNDFEPPALSDTDVLALSVIWEHRRQSKADGIKILLLPFAPCPTCGEIVDEVIIGSQNLATLRQLVTMQPCGHVQTVSDSTLLRLQKHMGEMLADLEDANLRGRGASVEAILREARARTTPDNPVASGDAPDNPPGSTREQLPDNILALLAHRTYLSTACETARLLDGAIIRNPERADLPGWRDRMHARCRLSQKFTGSACSCHCHKPPAP